MQAPEYTLMGGLVALVGALAYAFWPRARGASPAPQTSVRAMLDAIEDHARDLASDEIMKGMGAHLARTHRERFVQAVAPAPKAPTAAP